MRSVRQKIIGLIGKKTLDPDTFWFFQNVTRVHTAFMRVPIDVGVLDANDRMIHIERGMKPWRASPRIRGAAACVETADGGLTGMRLFDRILN